MQTANRAEAERSFFAFVCFRPSCKKVLKIDFEYYSFHTADEGQLHQTGRVLRPFLLGITKTRRINPTAIYNCIVLFNLNMEFVVHPYKSSEALFIWSLILP